MIEIFAGAILYGELDPGLIEISDFGDQGVADVLVLDDYQCLNQVVWFQAEGHRPERRNHLLFVGLFQRDYVYIQKGARLEKRDCFFQLLVETVIERYSRVAGKPAMRGKGAVLRSRVRQVIGRSFHMAALTGCKVAGVEGQGVPPGELGALPLVVGRKSADKLVVVQRIWQIGLMAGAAEFRSPIEALHHRLRVALRMLVYILVWDLAWEAIPFFVYHHRRNTHHETAVPLNRLQFLDRVAGGAGEPILIHLPVDL